VLVRLQSEVSRPGSILGGGGSSAASSTVNTSGDSVDEKMDELVRLVRDCERVLRVLKEILEKVCVTHVHFFKSSAFQVQQR
jgi:hypothetical protein